MIKMKWRKYSKFLRIDNTFMVMDIPFGAGTQRGGWNSGGGGITSFTPLNTPLCTLIHPFYPSFSPLLIFFPQQSSTSFPTSIEFFSRKFYGCGEAGKGLLGKKRRKWFSPILFFPQILSFYIFSPTASFPLNGSWREWFSPFLIFNFNKW